MVGGLKVEAAQVPVRRGRRGGDGVLYGLLLIGVVELLEKRGKVGAGILSVKVDAVEGILAQGTG